MSASALSATTRKNSTSTANPEPKETMMTYALPNTNIDLPADMDQPPERPSYESCALAAAFVLSLLGGMTGTGEIATPVATCLVVVAMCLGVFEVGRWAYRRFRHGQ